MLADDDARLLVDPLEQRRADADIRRAADDGVVRVDAERREERVHRAAHALVEARLAPENFRERAVQQEIDRQVFAPNAGLPRPLDAFRSRRPCSPA